MPAIRRRAAGSAPATYSEIRRDAAEELVGRRRDEAEQRGRRPVSEMEANAAVDRCRVPGGEAVPSPAMDVQIHETGDDGPLAVTDRPRRNHATADLGDPLARGLDPPANNASRRHDPPGEDHPATFSVAPHAVALTASASSADVTASDTPGLERDADESGVSGESGGGEARQLAPRECHLHRRGERHGQRVARATQTPADDEDLDVEHRHGSGEHGGQGIDGVAPHRSRRRIALDDERRDVAGIDRPDCPAGRRDVSLGDRPRRGDAFERASGGDMDLADLAGPKRRPGPDHPVDHDGGGEAGTDRHEQRRVGAGGSPERRLGHRCGAHVVADSHRPIEPFGEPAAHRRVVPTHRHRQASNPIVVDDSRDGDTDSDDVEAEIGALVDERRGDGGDVVEHRIRAELPATRHSAQDVESGRPEDPGLQRRAADIDGHGGEAIEVVATHLSAGHRRARR